MSRVTLQCPQAPSDTGAYRIAWTTGGAAQAAFRLEENGKLLYAGPQQATAVSGRTAGEYHYRIGMAAGDRFSGWLDECSVAVQPPSLSLALTLFTIGLVVSVATLLLVVRGHRAHRRAGSAR